MTQSTLQIPEVLQKYESDIKATKRDFIKIKTVTNDKVTIEDSKVGGIPYWPKSTPFVKIGGKKGKLIAQINFDKLKKEGILLEHYPQTGILQFFIAPGDDIWGLDSDDSYKVIYHEDITPEHSNDEEMIEISLDNEGMAFHSILELKFSQEEEYLGLSDLYNRNLYKINVENLNDEETEAFYELSSSGSKIGGYAYFTQEDPRYEPDFQEKDEWLLLFQLDSDNNLMWGDCGVANWFIKKEDLINKNFKNVFFTWDCC